jgi:hypothetical protein
MLALKTLNLKIIEKCFLSFDYCFSSVKLNMNRNNINRLLIIVLLVMSFKYLIIISLPLIINELQISRNVNWNSILKILFNKYQCIKNKHCLKSTYFYFTIGSLSLMDYETYNLDGMVKIHDGTHPFFLDTPYNHDVENVYKIPYLLEKEYVHDKLRNYYKYPYGVNNNPKLYGGGPCFPMNELYAGKLQYFGTRCTKYFKEFNTKYLINTNLVGKLITDKKETIINDSFFGNPENDLPTLDMENFSKNHNSITDYIKNMFGFYTDALHSIIDKPQGPYADAKGFDLHYKHPSTPDKIIAIVDIARNSNGIGRSLSSFKELLYDKPMLNSLTVFGVHQIGQYISFFIYKPSFHLINNMERKAFCYRDILGLYVTQDGIKVIAQANTIHPQAIFYNFNNDNDKVCIHVMLRYIASCTKVPNINIDNNELQLDNHYQSKTLTALIKYKQDKWGIDEHGNIKQDAFETDDINKQYSQEGMRIMGLMSHFTDTQDYNK